MRGITRYSPSQRKTVFCREATRGEELPGSFFQEKFIHFTFLLSGSLLCFLSSWFLIQLMAQTLLMARNTQDMRVKAYLYIFLFPCLLVLGIKNFFYIGASTLSYKRRMDFEKEFSSPSFLQKARQILKKNPLKIGVILPIHKEPADILITVISDFMAIAKEKWSTLSIALVTNGEGEEIYRNRLFAFLWIHHPKLKSAFDRYWKGKLDLPGLAKTIGCSPQEVGEALMEELLQYNILRDQKNLVDLKRALIKGGSRSIERALQPLPSRDPLQYLLQKIWGRDIEGKNFETLKVYLYGVLACGLIRGFCEQWGEDFSSKKGFSSLLKKLQLKKKNTFAEVYYLKEGSKARALNYGMEQLWDKVDYFLCVDSDSTLEKEALWLMYRHFLHDEISGDGKLAAVAGQVKIRNPLQNWLIGCQHIEYMSANGLLKESFNPLGMVSVVPGPVGMFKKSALATLPEFPSFRGFKEGDAGPECIYCGKTCSPQFHIYCEWTTAEDTEITLLLLLRGYRILFEPRAESYTWGIPKVALLKRQRHRWSGGISQVSRKVWKEAPLNPVFSYMLFESTLWPFWNMITRWISLFLLMGICLLGKVETAFWIQLGWVWMGFVLIDLSSLLFSAKTQDCEFPIFPLGLLYFVYRSSFSTILDVFKIYGILNPPKKFDSVNSDVLKVKNPSGQPKGTPL